MEVAFDTNGETFPKGFAENDMLATRTLGPKSRRNAFFSTRFSGKGTACQRGYRVFFKNCHRSSLLLSPRRVKSCVNNLGEIIGGSHTGVNEHQPCLGHSFTFGE